MAYALTYTSPAGASLALSTDTQTITSAWPADWPASWTTSGATIKLIGTPEGLSSTRGELISRKSPGQYGSTGIDRLITGRTVSCQAYVEADGFASTQKVLDELGELLAGSPSFGGDPVTLGTLKVSRPDQPEVQAPTQPQDSPRVAYHRGPKLIVDLEFVCPDPAWREVTDRLVTLQAGESGYSFPLTVPFTIQISSDSATITNPGHLPTPMVVRMHGEQTFPRLEQSDTGEVIAVEGTISADEYVEVDTGAKTVELVAADGTRSNVLDRWDFDASTFWRLVVGDNPVEWTAGSRSSDSFVDVIYNPRLAGI